MVLLILSWTTIRFTWYLKWEKFVQVNDTHLYEVIKKKHKKAEAAKIQKKIGERLVKTSLQPV